MDKMMDKRRCFFVIVTNKNIKQSTLKCHPHHFRKGSLVLFSFLNVVLFNLLTDIMDGKHICWVKPEHASQKAVQEQQAITIWHNIRRLNGTFQCSNKYQLVHLYYPNVILIILNFGRAELECAAPCWETAVKWFITLSPAVWEIWTMCGAILRSTSSLTLLICTNNLL